MKTATLTSPSTATKPAILLIGPPGGAKTTLAMQFPNVYFADCDLNLTGPENYLRKSNKELVYCYDHIPLMDNGRQRLTKDCFDHLLNCLDTAAKDDNVQTIVIDSLTNVNEYIIQKIIGSSGKAEMTIKDWQPFKSKFLELIFSHSRNTGKTVIMTVHETIIEETDPKNFKSIITGYRPSLNGSITDYFGAFFTDVWRCTSQPGPLDKTEFLIHTSKTTKSDLKNSMGLPPCLKGGYKELSTYLPK